MPVRHTVRAVNRLTSRWGREAAEPGRSTVFSAPGAWAPLAFLAAGSGGPAAAEFADALAVRTADAAEAGRELNAALGRIRGVRTALGLWTRDRLPVEPAWAAQQTGGRFRGYRSPSTTRPNWCWPARSPPDLAPRAVVGGDP
ncbi:hypothetical protein [Streptomyces sp. TLI_171]|uniref:hypothetical protein n=1 Tax=Streptomyces sp. TLI_171 TaxID=1938859 RepID=UPI000C69A615|nr:hypothetical protein [Streptomyces sp. TLI_171]RKE22268.1 hypothetical protein BX266_5707 [Streptomyces sp. TLI_171]